MSEGPGDLRRLRKDDRRRHDGVDPEHPPGEVIHLDPATMKPKRRNVTAEDATAKLADQDKLTWAEQGERVRRLNSILLSRITQIIEDGRPTLVDIHGSLAKLSDIAKKWSAETRANGDGETDASKLTDEEIERRLKKK